MRMGHRMIIHASELVTLCSIFLWKKGTYMYLP